MKPLPGRLYFDYAATTPLRPEVLEAMLPHLGGQASNASSLHAEGRAARAALDEARTTVARAIGAKPREIVFTGGGSEADNLAVLGAARAARRERGGAHVVTAATEHRAVLEPTEVLRGEGFDITTLGVDGDGRISVADFTAALRPDTVFASFMLANNELGTLHPIADLARAARAAGVVFHSDAVQGAGRVPLDAGTLGVDLMSLSAHKVGGPKGVGLLYVRAGTPVLPLALGGGQEAGLRSGTENIAGIVGFARALQLAVAERQAEAERLAGLRDRLEAGLAAAILGVRVNGAGASRLPHISSVAFAGVEAPALLVRLDLEGAAVSAGSACAAGSNEPSHVVAALGAPTWVERGTIRMSLGNQTTARDVESLVQMLVAVISAMRVASGDLGTIHSGSGFRDRTEVRS